MERWSLFIRFRCVSAIGLLGLAVAAQADVLPADCGDLQNSYGPYDYTNPEHFQHKLPVVEKFHFSKEQELSTYKPGSKMKVDFGYTLRAFPNHHRALMALTRWLKLHKPEEWTSEMRAECFYHRALAWRPRDSVARMIFALYLHQNQRLSEAESQYQLALKVHPNYAEAHYNLGLLYTEQKRWPEALTAAHRAYALNYPLPGLKKRLVAAKVWQEPAPAEPPKPVDARPGEPSANEPSINDHSGDSGSINDGSINDRSTDDSTASQSTTTPPEPTPTPTSAEPTPGTSR